MMTTAAAVVSVPIRRWLVIVVVMMMAMVARASAPNSGYVDFSLVILSRANIGTILFQNRFESRTRRSGSSGMAADNS
jgi:hypothetical protein